MHSPIQIISILSSLIIILFVIQRIRQRKLRVEYSIWWISGSLFLIAFSIKRDLIDIIADYAGVAYAPAILLLVGIFFGVLISMHFTVVISRLTDQNKALVQEIALLKNRLEEIEGSSD